MDIHIFVLFFWQTQDVELILNYFTRFSFNAGLCRSKSAIRTVSIATGCYIDCIASHYHWLFSYNRTPRVISLVFLVLLGLLYFINLFIYSSNWALDLLRLCKFLYTPTRFLIEALGPSVIYIISCGFFTAFCNFMLIGFRRCFTLTFSGCVMKVSQ